MNIQKFKDNVSDRVDTFFYDNESILTVSGFIEDMLNDIEKVLEESDVSPESCGCISLVRENLNKLYKKDSE